MNEITKEIKQLNEFYQLVLQKLNLHLNCKELQDNEWILNNLERIISNLDAFKPNLKSLQQDLKNMEKNVIYSKNKLNLTKINSSHLTNCSKFNKLKKHLRKTQKIFKDINSILMDYSLKTNFENLLKTLTNLKNKEQNLFVQCSNFKNKNSIQYSQL